LPQLPVSPDPPEALLGPQQRHSAPPGQEIDRCRNDNDTPEIVSGIIGQSVGNKHARPRPLADSDGPLASANSDSAVAMPLVTPFPPMPPRPMAPAVIRIDMIAITTSISTKVNLGKGFREQN
jgi:hypothetical protein